MKSHPKVTVTEWNGQYSADPADRIGANSLAVLRNGYCDNTGRIVKSHGVSIVCLASSWGLVGTDGRVIPRSGHVFQGRNGQNPDSKMIVVVGPSLKRSKSNDLISRWDDITFPTDMPTPGLDLAAAGCFRDAFFYHQNGADFPFRLKCEEDAPATTLTLAAEALGLKPPTFGMHYAGKTVGNAKRFPPNVNTSYAVTFVYGTRGESGPSLIHTLQFTTGDGTNDSVSLDDIPLGPTGCTARRIYRTAIGRGIPGANSGPSIINRVEKGTYAELFLLAEIADNTTQTYTDSNDDAALDVSTRCPQPRPFPPIARYQIMHLDRLFWAKLREHPWILGVMADRTRAGFTNYRVTISNTGSGTITFEKFNGGWSTDFTITAYKTKTLRAILALMLAGASGSLAGTYTTTGVAAQAAAGIDLDRTYAFMEISQREIYATSDVYWMVAIDDVGTYGTRWFPNRFMWSDITFPEQVSWLNSADLTRFGSKRITNLILMDNTPIIETDTDSWMIPGSFIPDDFGVPSFEVHRSQASHGSICTRPDACVTVPNTGVLMVAHDALRNFRGESSDLAAVQIRDVFHRVLTEPVCRDQLNGIYHSGEIFIALPTEETGGSGSHN